MTASTRSSRRRGPRLVFLATACACALSLVLPTQAEDKPAVPAPAPPQFPAPFTDRIHRKNLKKRGGDDATEVAVTRALAWLAARQRDDGSWSSDPLRGHDTGVTGLALLALMARGNVPGYGPHRDAVSKGLRFLVSRQGTDGHIHAVPLPAPEPEPEPGKIRIIKPLIDHMWETRDVYDHAIAAQCLAEAFLLTRLDEFECPAQRAMDWIRKAKNPYLGWRYDCPPDGDNDTSVTGWMAHAIWIAREAGLDVETSALKEAIAWFEKVTNPETGRTGYQKRGGPSASPEGGSDNTGFYQPTRPGTQLEDFGEANTAIALTIRLFNGDKPKSLVMRGKHDPRPLSRFDLLVARRPRWSSDGRGVDFYAWYWGTLTLSQAGGRAWETWNSALKAALIPNQAPDGSWPPIDIWGRAGPVYSTALACLCLESYTRYDMLFDEQYRLR